MKNRILTFMLIGIFVIGMATGCGKITKSSENTETKVEKIQEDKNSKKRLNPALDPIIQAKEARLANIKAAKAKAEADKKAAEEAAAAEAAEEAAAADAAKKAEEEAAAKQAEKQRQAEANKTEMAKNVSQQKTSVNVHKQTVNASKQAENNNQDDNNEPIDYTAPEYTTGRLNPDGSRSFTRRPDESEEDFLKRGDPFMDITNTNETAQNNGDQK